MIRRWMLVILMLSIPQVAAGGIPMNTAKAGVDKILKIAGDPALSGQQAVKEEKIRKTIGEFFDFKVLSQLSLGRNWKKLSSS